MLKILLMKIKLTIKIETVIKYQVENHLFIDAGDAIFDEQKHRIIL